MEQQFQSETGQSGAAQDPPSKEKTRLWSG